MSPDWHRSYDLNTRIYGTQPQASEIMLATRPFERSERIGKLLSSSRTLILLFVDSFNEATKSEARSPSNSSENKEVSGKALIDCNKVKNQASKSVLFYGDLVVMY